MEEKILAILADTNEELLGYNGSNMLADGLVNSFEFVGIITDLEDEFDIEIDEAYVVEEYFGNKDKIIETVRMILNRE